MGPELEGRPDSASHGLEAGIPGSLPRGGPGVQVMSCKEQMTTCRKEEGRDRRGNTQTCRQLCSGTSGWFHGRGGEILSPIRWLWLIFKNGTCCYLGSPFFASSLLLVSNRSHTSSMTGLGCPFYKIMRQRVFIREDFEGEPASQETCVSTAQGTWHHCGSVFWRGWGHVPAGEEGSWKQGVTAQKKQEGSWWLPCTPRLRTWAALS